MTRYRAPILCIATLILAPPLFAAAPPQRTAPELPLDQKARADRIWSIASPAAKSWATQHARAVAVGPGDPYALANAAASQSKWAVLGNLQGADIEALAFLVLMEASKSAQEDLKAIMDRVKAQNEAKAKLRAALEKVQRDLSANAGRAPTAPCTPPACGLSAADVDTLHRLATPARKSATSLKGTSNLADLRNAEKTVKSDLDSISEMGEMESLRLQMAMDRMSKMMSTLSNILKKISDTAQSITQNLK